MLESLLEPAQPDSHDACVDKDRSREHGENIEEGLLVRLDGVRIYTAHKAQLSAHRKDGDSQLDSRVQSRLRTCAAGEEEGVDIAYVGASEYYD